MDWIRRGGTVEAGYAQLVWISAIALEPDMRPHPRAWQFEYDRVLRLLRLYLPVPYIRRVIGHVDIRLLSAYLASTVSSLRSS